MTNKDSYAAMMDSIKAFHHKNNFKELGGEDLVYRVCLMTEELGEIAACVSKGKPVSELAEECADLLILLMGTALSADIDLNTAFWDKMRILEQRQSKMINGRIRVSEFSEE